MYCTCIYVYIYIIIYYMCILLYYLIVSYAVWWFQTKTASWAHDPE